MTPELSPDVFEELTDSVRGLGGNLDSHTASIAGFYMPAAAGFPSIERVFIDFVKHHPDAEWIFGNVYDSDEKPLNWW